MKTTQRIKLLKEFISLAEQEIQELEQEKKGICWFCGTEITRDENYKFDNSYFCSDKCINNYKKAEQEKHEKRITETISQERDKRQDELNKLLFKQDK